MTINWVNIADLAPVPRRLGVSLFFLTSKGLDRFPPAPGRAGSFAATICGRVRRVMVNFVGEFACNISGLFSTRTHPNPQPYDCRKFRRAFLAAVGSRVVPFEVPPNILKLNTYLENGTLELWNRIFSYARAPTLIHSWFHSSKVPFVNKINKIKELAGTMNGTVNLAAVPLSKNLLNIRCLLA